MVFEFPDAATNDSDDIDGGEGIHLASQRQFMFGNAILGGFHILHKHIF